MRPDADSEVLAFVFAPAGVGLARLPAVFFALPNLPPRAAEK